jgi:RNA polymerase sigma factor (sigma-70 family)
MFEPDVQQALVIAASAGDTTATEQLLLANYTALHQHVQHKLPDRAARHFSADDILQQVFSQVFRDICRFEPRREASLLAWLKTIADHRLIDALRKIDKGGMHQVTASHATSAESLRDLIDVVCHESATPSRKAASNEAIAAMQVAIAALPSDQQEVIRLHWLEQKSASDIARETGRTEAAVRGLIYRGQKNLEAAMGRASEWLTRR